MNAIKRLRIIAWLEGISFLVLIFVAMPLKYFADEPWLNKQVGMAHGLLFVLYVILVIEVKLALNWSLKKTAIALGASIVPFGTFYINDKWIRRN
jgi:integral membrane protein